MNKRIGTVAGLASVLIGLGALGTGCDDGKAAASKPSKQSVTPGPPQAGPTMDPSRFAHPEANRYYPLTPGLVTTLRGSDEDGTYVERVEVTHQTRTIMGVRAVVISDVLRRTNGVLAEKTSDWYAADDAGNVWYFGEDTGTYDEHGKLQDKEGSWEAGRDGAQPGLIMPADPQAGQAYRQEYHQGDAEDQAWIVGNADKVTVPAGTYDHVVRSYEWTRLEPGVVSLKFYAPGVGIVAEKDIAGGHEQFRLTGRSG